MRTIEIYRNADGVLCCSWDTVNSWTGKETIEFPIETKFPYWLLGFTYYKIDCRPESK